MIDFNTKRKILTQFAEIGAMLLPVEEFMHIVSLNFHAEIEAQLFNIAEQHQVKPEDIWSTLENLIDRCDLEHPILQAVFRNDLIRALIGPEYTTFNRYPEVYDTLLRGQHGAFNIAVIGCSYGQEILSMLTILHQEMVKNTDFNFSIDIYNKPTPIFHKIQTSMRYPVEILQKYMSAQQIALYFESDENNTLRFSKHFLQKVKFHELDLLNLSNVSSGQYDLLLIHNVLQYLEPSENENTATFQRKAQASFDWLSAQVKSSGIVSIINESRKPNAIVAQLQDNVFNRNPQFSCTEVKPALLCRLQTA